MIKSYVIDTNVLLQDPESIFEFEDNTVIIPIGVIEELDKFKKDSTELGRNARQVSRSLDKLREEGDLREGVKIRSGGILAVRYNGNLQSFYKEQNIDLHVIHVAQETIKKSPETPCIIVTQDVNVRIRANALGLQAEGYEGGKVPTNDLDKGYIEIEVDEKLFEKISSSKETKIEESNKLYEKLIPNYYLIIKKEGSKKTILGRVSSDGSSVKKLIGCPTKMTIAPKNKEQSFLVDALMDTDIKLVCIAGKAGTGKTLLSVAIGHYLTVEKNEYKKMLVSRPVFPMGKDLGYLPGDINEKLDPWMTPIYDALEIIYNNKNSGRDIMKQNHSIVVEPLTYIRGRSIHNQFIIIDESQNLTALEIKTIITRAGENTKIILTGDINQIDNPYIDSLSNGLSVVMEAFKGSSLAVGLVLDKGVRSELAEEASNKL